MHNKPHTEEAKQKMSKSHKGIPNKHKRRKTIEKNGIVFYQCGVCKEFKPYEDFYKDKRTILGIKAECKNVILNNLSVQETKINLEKVIEII